MTITFGFGDCLRHFLEIASIVVTVSAVDAGAGEEAMGMIQALVEDPEIDRVYTGKVKRVMDFGAFIEILPGKEGPGLP